MAKHKSGCTVNKTFLPLKLAYFTMAAGGAALWNFLQLHQKSKGLSPSEIGFIQGVPPFLGMLSTVVSGIVADRFRIHSQLSATLQVVSTCVITLLFFVPAAPTNSPCNMPSFNISSPAISPPQLAKIFFSQNNGKQDIISSDQNLSCCDATLHLKFTLNCDTDNHLLGGSKNTSRRHEPSGGKVTPSTRDPSLLQLNCSFSIKDALHVPLWAQTDCHDFELYHNSSNPMMLQISPSRHFCTKTSSHLYCFNMTSINKTDSTLHPERFGTTFWMYLAVFSLSNFIGYPVWSQINAIAYAMLGNKRNSWGKHRLWGTIGDAVVVVPVSLVMHHYGTEGQPNFEPAFLVNFIFTMVACVFIWRLKGKVEVYPKKSLWKDLKQIFKIREIYVILVLAFSFGFYLSGMWTILALYVVSFPNGNEVVLAMGIIMTLAGETPLLFFARNLMDKFGYVRCIYLTCAGFALRFFLYSIIWDPWLILPINLLHGITFGVMYSTLTAYASSLTPPALHGTMQGLLSTLAWSLGGGTASIIYGEMMDRIGARSTFAVSSACSLGTLVLYFAYVNLVHACSKCGRTSQGKSNGALQLKSPSREVEDDERPLVNDDDDSFGSEDELYVKRSSTTTEDTLT